MTTSFEHPTLTLPVTDAERAAAGQRLRLAYDSGRLDANDYDRRAGIAALATTRRELNSAFLGLVDVSRPPYRIPTSQGSAAGVVAHVSSLVFFVVGPLFVFAVTSPGSRGRREAAKAFNLSFLTLLGLVATVLVGAGVGHVGPLLLATGAYWFFSTVVSIIQAGQGLDWNHPLKRWLPWEILKEG